MSGLQVGDVLCSSNPQRSSFYQIVRLTPKRVFVRRIMAEVLRTEGCWDDTPSKPEVSNITYQWLMPYDGTLEGDEVRWKRTEFGAHTFERYGRHSIIYRKVNPGAVFFGYRIAQHFRARAVEDYSRADLLQWERGNWCPIDNPPDWWAQS